MAQQQQAILSIDAGTSGTRAALITADATVCAVNHCALSTTSASHNVVEQDANNLLQKTLEMCRKTIAAAKAENKEIIALALATQRATSILWHTETGQALVPAMVWQDFRYAQELEPLGEIWNKKLLPLVGRPVGGRSVYLWAAHHLRDTPAVRAAWDANKLAFGTVDSWLLWHLSESRRVVTTPTNATSAGAYILQQNSYYTDWTSAQGFPTELLPELKQDADDFGHTRQDILGIRVPIKASCGDQLAGLVGLGCHDPGQATCVHGTGSFFDLVVGKDAPKYPEHCESTYVMTAWRAKHQSHFAVETYVPTTGGALNWLCETMHWFRDVQEIAALAATASSANGLVFIPALTGLRLPSIMPQGRASLTGLSMAHNRSHLAYAIIEGIAHSVVSCAEASAAISGISVQEVIAGGGLSANQCLLQLQADLSGIPVRRLRGQTQSSLRGTAFLAGSDGTMWDSLSAARANLVTEDMFLPRISESERQERREKWHALLKQEVDRIETYRIN